MKTIIRNLTGALLVAAAALGMGRLQGSAQEIRPRDIKAQQPQEVISGSDPCQRARESSRHSIWKRDAIDPKTLAQDLNTLMERSDEVILAGFLDAASVISPNGKSTVTYEEVRVIRSWKGSHHGGDTLTFGVPYGEVSCEPTGRFDGSIFSVMPDDFGVPAPEPFAWVSVLFLRQSKDEETQLVQGLRPAAGQGVQGMFTIKTPAPTQNEPVRECGGNQWSWQRCNAYLGASEIPVEVPYAHDPLAKRYGGMPASDFLHEVQSVAAGEGLVEKSFLR
jgi:hypothetical protein